MPNQIGKNGDAGKTLVVKMDVEGAELDSLLATPDGILNTFDQLVIELHRADRQFLDLVRKLKRLFHVVHLHYNNSVCTTQWKPFPSPVYEVSFVNKRIGIPDPAGPTPVLPNVLDAQNNLFRQDCRLLCCRNPSRAPQTLRHRLARSQAALVCVHVAQAFRPAEEQARLMRIVP